MEALVEDLWYGKYETDVNDSLLSRITETDLINFWVQSKFLNSERCFLISHDFSQNIFTDIKHFISQQISNNPIRRLNDLAQIEYYHQKPTIASSKNFYIWKTSSDLHFKLDLFFMTTHLTLLTIFSLLLSNALWL
jgi:hypothetical protein